VKRLLIILLFIVVQFSPCEQGSAWSNYFALVDQNNSLKYSASGTGSRLLTAAPNPFRNMVSITFHIPARTGRVELKIYNTSGMFVNSRKNLKHGYGKIIWDGRDTHGRLLSSGIYIVRLSVDGKIENRNVLLLK
jgi:flagellar hook assembly protein FlgD